MNDSSQTKTYNLDDIAAELGLSKSTVSRAISGKGRVSPSTREKVLECIKVLNYHPNSIAKSLSESKTYNIGVVVPMDSDETEAPFFQTCLMGISRECAMRDYDVVVIGTEKKDLSQLERVLNNRKVDGVIVTRPVKDHAIETLIKEHNAPFVVIGQSGFKGAVTIDSAHKEACRELTSYLLMSNRPDKIGLLMNSMSFNVNKSRYEGFESAFEAIDTRPSDNMVYIGIDGTTQFSRAVASLLKEQPDCIICGDDMICMKLLAEINGLGLKIPENIKVASFYDSVFLDMYTPPITSLVFDASELGESAAAVLLDLINGENVMESVDLNFEMLIRRSTM